MKKSRSTAKCRNRLPSTICRLVRVEDVELIDSELDPIGWMPALDIKPMIAELLPREPMHQRNWSRELMLPYSLPRP
jgi:tRNA (Thr-GGU) A37 N-methylase